MFKKLFQSVNPEELKDNFFNLINNEWMLITAGEIDHFNTMTANWGTIGVLWNRLVAICFIRPQRYTYEFVERSEIFTMSFFPDDFKEALNYCGSHSGRSVDKIAKTGLTPIETPDGSVSFEQSRIVFECRKLYTDFIKEENFLATGLVNKHYGKKDFHKFFIAEITDCYVKEEEE
ncbi:MAG TPA: flavin reductase family protein [Bacteroidales bacterium]|nr:flavin reductase family protein [Bacteroidales bacterium]